MSLSDRVTIEIEGCNGKWFTISGPGQGAEGVWLGTEVDGIYDAPVKTIYTEHAHQIGATFADYRNLKRDIIFGVYVGNTDSNTWEENDSEWRKAWAYHLDTKMWITSPEGSRRYLKLRLGEQPMFKPEHDPHLTKIEKAVMTVVAGDPWWYEAKDYTDQWTLTAGNTGSGSVVVSNPTDQEVWMKWIVKGSGKFGLPDFSFGDDRFGRAVLDASRGIVLPAAVQGQTYLVDTDPFEDQLRDANGAQVWSMMNGISFNYSLPPYLKKTTLPVQVANASPGAGVQVRVPRTWSRPWGMR